MDVEAPLYLSYSEQDGKTVRWTGQTHVQDFIEPTRPQYRGVDDIWREQDAETLLAHFQDLTMRAA